MNYKKSFVFLSLFFVILKLHAQKIAIPTEEKENKKIEAIIVQVKGFTGDTISLKKYLNPLSQSQQLKPIYHALLANGYSTVFDHINKQSNKEFLKSIALAKNSKKNAIEIWTKLNYVNYLYNYRDYPNLTPLLLDVINRMRTISPKEMIFPGECFKQIGWILQTFEDYENSQYYLKLAEHFSTKNTSEYASIINTIGVNYFNTNNLQKSVYYFNKTVQLSKKIKDTSRYAKALGSLALIHQKTGNYKKAILLVKQDISLSESCRDDKNTMYALTLLSDLYISVNDLENAKIMLNKATIIASNKLYYNISESKIIELKLAILQKQGKTDDELVLRRRLDVLQDSLKTKDGTLATKNAYWFINEAKFQENIKQSKLQYQREHFFKKNYEIIIILVSILALCIYYDFTRRLKNRNLAYLQKVMSLENDKHLMERKLTLTHEGLNAQIDYLKSKNIQIKKLKNEINTIKQSSYHYLETKNGKLAELLDSHLMTENNWKLFKKEFDKVHPDFYKILLTEFKEITDSNLRILLLQKLNFSNNEIAELLGVTPEAIKKSKQRLKKKLGGKFELLNDYLTVNSN